MLILRESTEGVWISHTYRGAKIELKIRAVGAEKMDAIRRRHKRIEYVRDTQSKQMTKVEVFDEEAIFLEIVDYVLEDFKGFGTAKDRPLEVTKENKRRILLIPPLAGEQPLFDFVLEKAKELETISEEELQAEIKN